MFSRSGKSKQYRSLRQATGYGTGAGLGGWNCRHSFFPYFEGSPSAYSKELLDDYEAKKYEYNGQKMTEYEASQEQRRIERNIRRWKREHIAMEAAGQDTAQSASKIAQWNKTQKDFLKQTGLKEQRSRTQVVTPQNAKLGGGGIKNTVITQKAIDSIPFLTIAGYTDEQASYIQSQHKELLRVAQTKGEKDEVAFSFTKDFSRHTVAFGEKQTVSPNVYGLGDGVFVMHNHPMGSSYSQMDLDFFIRAEVVQTLSIVKNQGGVEILTKLPGYDSIKAKLEYSRNFRSLSAMDGDSKKDKAVKTWLKNMKKIGMIEWKTVL